MNGAVNPKVERAAAAIATAQYQKIIRESEWDARLAEFLAEGAREHRCTSCRALLGTYLLVGRYITRCRKCGAFNELAIAAT